MEDQNLPEGWSNAKLSDLGPIVSGGTPKTSEPSNFDGDIPWITPADLTGYESKAISAGRRNITVKGLESSSARIIPKRSVLFSSRAPIGYVAIAANNVATNQGFKSVVVHEDIDENYIYFYLKSAKHLAEQNASGTTFKEISGSRFAKLPIAMAPLNEQRRIVEKIESLFAQLDHGESSLRDVQKLLARYRQSVLKAAVTGQLTADWRAENADRLESGRDLLERILQARRENWQGRGKYKEPVAPDTSDLPELPEGWVWVTLGALVKNGPQNGVYFPKSKYGSGTPILRIDDYQIGWVRSRDGLRVVGADCEEVDRYALNAGDFVVNRVNSVSHLGKISLVSKEYEGVLFESNMMRFSVSCEISKEYLYFYLSSLIGKKHLIKNCKHAVNQASINQGDVSSTPVPLPPLLEQEEIAQRLAAESSRELSTKHWCQAELTRSAALRQSILKDAFAGKLVPQDPDDEPASELLARIRAERDAATSKKRTRKKATA